MPEFEELQHPEEPPAHGGSDLYRNNTMSGVASGAAVGAVLGFAFSLGLGGVFGSLLGAAVGGSIAAKHDADAVERAEG